MPNECQKRARKSPLLQKHSERLMKVAEMEFLEVALCGLKLFSEPVMRSYESCTRQ
jgi:hypothetical protein